MVTCCEVGEQRKHNTGIIIIMELIIINLRPELKLIITVYINLLKQRVLVLCKPFVLFCVY